MPYSVSNVPPAAKKLSDKQKEIFAAAANASLKDGKDEGVAIAIGLAAAKKYKEKVKKALDIQINGEAVEDKGLWQKLVFAIADYFAWKEYEQEMVDEAESEAEEKLGEMKTEGEDSSSLAEHSGQMIAKSLNEELRQGTFVVLEPNIVDLHGDVYSEEEVRKAAHNFNQFCERAYLDHKVETEDMTFVESYIAPVDMTIGDMNIVKGTWLAVCQFTPELWEEVKADPMMGLSVGCYAKVEELV